MLKRCDNGTQSEPECCKHFYKVEDFAKAEEVFETAASHIKENKKIGLGIIAEDELLGVSISYSDEDIYYIPSGGFITSDYLKDKLMILIKCSDNRNIVIDNLKDYLYIFDTQINRIRVNNVKYNFGTQFYDDFIMRFNCRNTIYDLANGGGKSLLMLLLMQNMIPNCTLDEKQPIEKLFRKGSDNTCIHSLVEWKLDNNAVKDGFRYMTTGFCARKARDAKDEENVTDGTDTLTQAQASSSDNTSVEYFNYCIFYRKFGENDIKNLPLAVNGERVTYNGLKAYLREAEKSDYNIKVYIFDRKGDYQSFISRYGIYESAWEIVRGINKTEGHVRTYFETNYRTSRKVVEDLLIEEIIQKSYNNRLSVDNDDSMMAKTLLDIKDKLIELSKKNSQINDYDNQIEALTYFKDYIATYKEFYSNKSNIEDKLANMLLSVINAEGRKEAELSEHNEKEQELYNELSDKNSSSQCIKGKEVIK